jgi:predicted transcriptional regulator
MPRKRPRQRKNKLKHQREAVLGLSIKELSDCSAVSEKTIQRIERQETGLRRVTYTKVLKGINSARKKDGLEPILADEMFPGLDGRPKKSKR